jgi:putative transposase
MQMRKAQYRLYPNAAQEAALDAACELHRRLYNAALEERIDAWRKAGLSIGLHEQSASLTVIRKDDPAYAELPRKALLHTLERLDLAFRAFFRRVKAGETPGFPRFKSRDRFKGFGFRTHGDGATFKSGKDRHGKLRIKGIPGLITARGKPRTKGEVRTLEISRKAGQWFLTVSLECEPVRACGDDIVALDWGVETLASCVFASGDALNAENTRIGRKGARRIKALSRKLARQKRTSSRRQQTKIRLAKAKMAEANRRKDRAHKLSAEIVSRAHVIAFEALTISNMTRSAKGTQEEPGRNVRQKSGLNREVLDTAPAQLMSMLGYKAGEADAWVMEAPTRKLKPSQTCPDCGRQRKKKLSERTHHCECGTTERRDPASARVVLNWALKELAREPGLRGEMALAVSANCETATFA